MCVFFLSQQQHLGLDFLRQDWVKICHILTDLPLEPVRIKEKKTHQGYYMVIFFNLLRALSNNIPAESPVHIDLFTMESAHCKCPVAAGSSHFFGSLPTFIYLHNEAPLFSVWGTPGLPGMKPENYYQGRRVLDVETLKWNYWKQICGQSVQTEAGHWYLCTEVGESTQTDISSQGRGEVE